MDSFEKLDKARAYLQDSLIERDEEIEHILSAILAEEHVFMIGVPGVAKSYLARKVFHCFDMRSFEITLNKNIEPKRIFGPVNLHKLKENSVIEYKTEGFFPDVEFAFLDEIWKANATLLQSFLTGLEERKFHNGNKVEDMPLLSVVSASNELPQEDSLRALYDRFLVRLEVKPIQKEENYKRYLKGNFKDTTFDDKITPEDLNNLKSDVEDIEIGDKFFDKLFELGRIIESESSGEIFVSDRKYKKAIPFLKAMVYLKGRDILTHDDLPYMKNVLWSEPEEKQLIESCLMNVVSQTVSAAQTKYNEIYKNAEKILNSNSMDKISELYDDYQKEVKNFNQYVNELKDTTQSHHLKEIQKKVEEKTEDVKEYYKEKMDITF